MASNKAALAKNAVSKLYYLQLITIRISTFFDEHFQLVKFYLKPSILFCEKGNRFRNAISKRFMPEKLVTSKR